MTLDATQLFSPLPSGVAPGVTPTSVPSGTWLANLLANAGALTVTSWDSGGVAWQELLTVAISLGVGDVSASIVAQGALLDFAATGSVTYANAQGVTVTVPVTPDPSIPTQNPTGALGWLDALADSVYSLQRIVATYAGGMLYLANTSGASFGTYQTGGFHVANFFSGATYSNTAPFTFSASSTAGTSISSVVNSGTSATITTSSAHGLSTGNVVYLSGVTGLTFGAITVTGATTFSIPGNLAGSYVSGGMVWTTISATFTADLIGPGSNAAPGQVTLTTTAVPGGAVSNVTSAWSGQPYQSNTSLAALCRAKLQSLSVNGPKGAYTYYAIAAASILAAQSPPESLTSAITRATPSVALGTGAVTTTVASANGAVPGATNISVLGATDAAPIVVNVTSTATMSTGMKVRIQGVLGNSAANGYWTITVVDGSHFSLNGSSGSGVYASGGIVEAGDLGLVDSVIQAYAVPNAVTAVTQSASPLSIVVSATVYVPLAYLADYGTSTTSNKGATAISALLPLLPIGGVTNIDGSSSGVLSISTVIATLFNAGQSAGNTYTISVNNVTINGNATDLPLSATQVAVPGAMAITVQGV
jgi:hypothetical protein